VPTPLEKVDPTLCFGTFSRNRKPSNFIRLNLDKNSLLEEYSIMPSNHNSASPQNQRVKYVPNPQELQNAIRNLKPTTNRHTPIMYLDNTRPHVNNSSAPNQKFGADEGLIKAEKPTHKYKSPYMQNNIQAKAFDDDVDYRTLIADQISKSAQMHPTAFDAINNENYKQFSTLVTKRVKEFTGQQNQNILDFFNTFDHLARLHDLRMSEKLTALQVLLGGTALRTYQSLQFDIQRDYDRLKQKLISCFTEVNRPDKARCLYESRKQEPNESVEKFFAEMWGLGRLAWPNWSDDQLRQDMTYRFVYGLSDEIQERVHLFGYPNSPEEARERAVNSEIGLGLKSKSTPICVNKASYNSFNRNPHHENSLVQQLLEKFDNMEKEIKLIKSNWAERNSYLGEHKNMSELPDNNCFRHYGPISSGHQRSYPYKPTYTYQHDNYKSQPANRNSYFPEQNFDENFYDGQNETTDPNACSPGSPFHSRNSFTSNRPNFTYQARTTYPNRNIPRSPNYRPPDFNLVSWQGNPNQHDTTNPCATPMPTGFVELINKSSVDQPATSNPTQNEAKSVTFLEPVSTCHLHLVNTATDGTDCPSLGSCVQSGSNPPTVCPSYHTLTKTPELPILSPEEIEEVEAIETVPPLYLPLVVGNSIVHALCDTGAQKTLVSSQFVDEILYNQPYENQSMTGNCMIDANKQEQQIYEAVRFRANIDQESFVFEASVAEDLSEMMIIGTDFMNSNFNKASINVHKRYIKLRGVKHSLLESLDEIPTWLMETISERPSAYLIQQTTQCMSMSIMEPISKFKMKQMRNSCMYVSRN